MDKIEQIEQKAKQRLRAKLIQISYKYRKLWEDNAYILGKKQQREIDKANRLMDFRINNQKRKLAGKPLKTKPINRVKKCDEVRSKYIRLKYWTCYTCGGIENLWCGHRITRKIWELRWDERNCRVQCFFRCNAKFSGNGEVIKFRHLLKAEWIDVEECDMIALRDNPKPNEQEVEKIYNRILTQFNSIK